MPRAYPARRCPAFTLLEVLSAIAVIALLFALSIGIVRGARQRTALARTKSELSLLAVALETYKRHYGDYPQSGPSAANSQRITGTSGPGLGAAQAVLFNALTGAVAPDGTAVNGPMCVEISKLGLELDINPGQFAVPLGTPPVKPRVNNAFVDAWGNRYLYFYRRSNAVPWDAPGYVLFSAGPDGAASTLPNARGVFSGATQSSGDNADNLYADKLP